MSLYREYKFNLDLVDMLSFNTVKIKQGDKNTTRLTISITQKGEEFIIPQDSTVEIVGICPEGYIMNYSCTVEDNQVLFTFTEKCTSNVGTFKCEIAILGTDLCLQTRPFCVQVVKSNK